MSELRENKSFIYDLIDKDLEEGNYNFVQTRFPPEPNGYLHIGHAKSICLNSAIASDYDGKFNLRFDDTNPEKEEQEYVDSIIEDVKWLGAEYEDRLYFASDYFDRMYDLAVDLIKKGKAYVCDLNPEQMREYRGTLTEAGKDSPYRNRSVEENLELFTAMKEGKFEDGSKVLRAKIDMSSPNLNMRDPIMYRIQKKQHHRQGDKWCIYPMYDWAHGIEDSIENISHSICTMEFENHRPLYNWFLENLDVYKPRQIEFARLNLANTVLSKRKLMQLVSEDHVNGWDDPRMPTISGLRRRGYTAQSIRKFCKTIGVAKFNSIVDMVVLENSLREELNQEAPRAMAVIDPIKVIITNYPEDKVEYFDAKNHPQDESFGTRQVAFSRELYIEREDYMPEAPKKFFRLSEGREVRFRYAYLITCEKAIRNEEGEVVELHCTYDPDSRGGNPSDGRKVKGTIHWLSATHAKTAEIRLYDNLFNKRDPNEFEDGKDFLSNLNSDSLKVCNGYVEASLEEAKLSDKYQFERLGYFCLDKDSSAGALVFNRSVTLREAKKKKTF